MRKVLNLRKKAGKSPSNFSKAEQGIRAEKILTNTNKYEEKIKISWEAPSFHYNPQKKYLALTIAALIAGAAGLMLFKQETQALTAIFLVLSSFVLILYSGQKPDISQITADQSGISIGNMHYPYRDLKSFWINYNPGGIKELSIESIKWYMPYVTVIIDKQNPIELRSLLINFLPEKEHQNSLIDHLARKIGL